MAKKTRLFSKESLLTSLKGFSVSVMAIISSLPLWILTIFLYSKGINGVATFFGIFSLVVLFLFFGYWASRWWNWK